MTEPLIQFDSISKRFGSCAANDRISFSVRAGSVHAILGENGAGKSTLVKILSGVLRPDAGRILLAGKELSLAQPREAAAAGIGIVHQQFTLISALAVWQNFVLASREGKGILRPRHQIAQLRQEAERAGLPFDPAARTGQLSLGERQRIEIFRALQVATAVLVLDEPTSVFTTQESAALIMRLRDLARQGLAVILITHKIREALQAADVVTVLRRGRVVRTVTSSEVIDESTLVALMIGSRELTFPRREPAARPKQTEPILSLRGVSARHGSRREILTGVNLDIFAGEILGVVGIAGNGQGVLFGLLGGLLQPSDGEVIRRQELSRDAVATIPEDPVTEGLAIDMTVRENLFLRGFDRDCVGFLGFLKQALIRSRAQAKIEAYGIRPPDPEATLRSLSGGNQQKVVVARELSRRHDLVLAFHPTRGLDVAAAADVHHSLAAAASQGSAVVLLSEDLDEVLQLADRIVVVHQGILHLAGPVASLTRETIAGMMVGLAARRASATAVAG